MQMSLLFFFFPLGSSTISREFERSTDSSLQHSNDSDWVGSSLFPIAASGGQTFPLGQRWRRGFGRIESATQSGGVVCTQQFQRWSGRLFILWSGRSNWSASKIFERMVVRTRAEWRQSRSHLDSSELSSRGNFSSADASSISIHFV